ncbi:MAG: tyrosine-type recombinase/integrase [Mycobacteriales bacterium]
MGHLRYGRRVPPSFAAERAISLSGELVWVVVDRDGFGLHEEATTFLVGLRARDVSVNTERVYAGRVALYLSYCASRGLEWSDPGFLGLKGFQDWLVTEPLPARSARVGAELRFRSRGTANAVLSSVCEFLRFGVTHGWVPARATAALSEPKFLRHLPPGYDPGEDDQFRRVMRPVFRFADTERGYEALSGERIEQILRLTCHARDFFLILLLLVTGMRVGEGLGLRREDMHLLASSRTLGCVIDGPHVHVRRRRDNANAALAKSRFPRAIPVTTRLVDAYVEYLHERDGVEAAAGCDMVFVNLFREPLGAPMSYSNVKDMFDRLARTVGFAVRPHMLRHTAATGWVRAGVDLDIVQHLLGHVSSSSMQPYLHVNDQDKRDAVERVAAAGMAGR